MLFREARIAGGGLCFPELVKEIVIAAWGVFGVAALLTRALVALTPVALEPFHASSPSVSAAHWVLTLVWVGVNAYAEGYRGFHRSFAPRVIERAFHLGRNPTPLRVVLAAPYAIGWFGAPRRILVTAWCVTLGILALVFSVRHLAQPWRGIVDMGVVVGLGVGLLSLLVLFVRRAAARMAAVPTA